MENKWIFLTWLILTVSALKSVVFAQDSNVTGQIFLLDSQGNREHMIGGQVAYLDQSDWSFTDEEGRFTLKDTGEDKIIVIHVSIGQDTFALNGQKNIIIEVKSAQDLETIEVNYERNTTEVSLLDPQLVQNMGEDEFLKAACCNLSESFVTNPSIDVSTTDAITGTKQIRLLGLEGPNVLYSLENIPSIRGFNALNGLRFIPGSWLSSIQISKGTGSVVNGYEGISGQINVELKKADEGDQAHLNLYLNQQLRSEANFNARRKINDKIDYGLLAHASGRFKRQDQNNDGFLDQPLESAYGLTNRFRYKDKNGWRSRLVIESSAHQQLAGEESYKKESNRSALWGLQSRHQRHGVWAKLGKTYKETPWRSFGSQYKAEYYDHSSKFGLRDYNNRQRSLYANFLYSSIISNTNHGIVVGANIAYDDFMERFDSLDFSREELVPGIYTEYTFAPNTSISLVAGLRVDHHSIYGSFITPRVHFRYSPWENLAIRMSAGKARRVANIISDNIGLLASNRQFNLPTMDNGNVYGLPMTECWTFGSSIQWEANISSRRVVTTLEYFRSDFTQAIVADRYIDAKQVDFYAVENGKFSNSFQVLTEIPLNDYIDIRVAYRFFDVQIDYKSGQKEVPLLAKHRFFSNLAVKTNNDWEFDYTLNFLGRQRLPETGTSPEAYRLKEFSPSFFTHTLQISKFLNARSSSIYLGVENLSGFRQDEQILSADDPFSDYFDASNIWGPINRQVVYLGYRYSWD